MALLKVFFTDNLAMSLSSPVVRLVLSEKYSSGGLR